MGLPRMSTLTQVEIHGAMMMNIVILMPPKLMSPQSPWDLRHFHTTMRWLLWTISLIRDPSLPPLLLMTGVFTLVVCLMDATMTLISLLTTLSPGWAMALTMTAWTTGSSR